MKQHSTEVVPAYLKVTAGHRYIFIYGFFTQLKSAVGGCNNYLYPEEFNLSLTCLFTSFQRD